MNNSTPIIKAQNLRKTYKVGRSEHTAVEDISFTMTEGRNLGIVGESGSGKSTLAKMIMGLEAPTSGEVWVCGEKMSAGSLSRKDRIRRARLTQMVYQDPFGSLDPRQSVENTLHEALKLHGYPSLTKRQTRVRELCDLVGLSTQQSQRTPRELSGGQRQRVAIARSLAVEPRLIVLDEAVAALDISIQAQILNLLLEVQQATGTDYVLISHDLAVISYLTDDVLVMQHGALLEQGKTREVLASPQHEYTRILRDSIPSMEWREPGVLEHIAQRLTHETKVA